LFERLVSVIRTRLILAVYLAAGEICSKDVEAAGEFSKVSADQGNALEQRRDTMALFWGMGVAQNVEEEVKYRQI
jgi:hypothetical protein